MAWKVDKRFSPETSRNRCISESCSLTLIGIDAKKRVRILKNGKVEVEYKEQNRKRRLQKF